MQGNLPTVEFFLAPNTSGKEDIEISKRLANAYHAAQRYEICHIVPEERPNDGVWEMSKHEFHGELLDALEKRSYIDIAEICTNALRHRVSHGLGSGAQTFTALTDLSRGGGRDAHSLLLVDRLAALAEAFGILPLENPEQGCYGENVKYDVFNLIEKIESFVGYSVGRPRVMGAYGMPLRDLEVVDFRVPDDVYCTHRLRQILKQFDGTPNDTRGKICRRVVEIGGGFGGMALFAARAGLKPYSIVDLPLINVLQGYFLIKCLGAEAVRLYGEEGLVDAINVMPWWYFYEGENLSLIHI